MKKILFFVAILLSIVSCKRDAIISESKSTSELVTISANISSESSRAVGDGTTVNRCILEVYNAEDNSLIGERQVAEISSGSVQFSVKLESGLNCKFVLWADYSANGTGDTFYNTSGGLQNITRTGEYTGNNDQLDAFYASKEFTVGETALNVEMKRPFAQLNIYSSDLGDLLDEADKPTKISVSFSSVYTSFNALEGTVTGEGTLQYAAPVEIIGSNSQMSYDYLFASADEQTLVDFTMSFFNESGTAFEPYQFSNIPLQRNYKTHVTGNLLTNSAKLNVVVEPEFETPDYSVDVYDGFSVDEPDIIGEVVNVNSAANMVYVLRNMGAPDFMSVKTVNINRDMDFADVEIENSDKQIALSINGNNHTIKNLVINEVASKTVAGFIPDFIGGTISNLNFDNISILRNESSSDGYAGIIAGRTYGSVVIENCRVTNSEVYGVNKVGAIVGFAAEGTLEIRDCYVENTTVTGDTNDGGDCGGIVGYISNTISSAKISGNKFINSIVRTTPGLLVDFQTLGRGASLYVGTCHLSSTSNISIQADADAVSGSKRIINGAEDGGLVRYQGLLGNIRSANLNGGKLFINGEQTGVDTSTDKKTVQ